MFFQDKYTKKLEEYCEKKKKLGFKEMLLLNPKELPLAHKYFYPPKKR